MPKAIVVEDADLNRIVKVTRATSAEHALRNVSMIYVLFGVGLMPVEIARLSVSDYLRRNGTVIEESQLRAEAAFNGKARPLLWTSKKLEEAIDAYLDHRMRLEQGTGLRPSESPAYRGFRPDSALFLARCNKGFAVLQQGEAGRSAESNSLTRLLNKLIREAGVVGATTASGLRTLGVQLYRKGGSIRDINEILGDGSLRRTQLLCKGDPVSISKSVAGVI